MTETRFHRICPAVRRTIGARETSVGGRVVLIGAGFSFLYGMGHTDR